MVTSLLLLYSVAASWSNSGTSFHETPAQSHLVLAILRSVLHVAEVGVQPLSSDVAGIHLQVQVIEPPFYARVLASSDKLGSNAQSPEMTRHR